MTHSSTNGSDSFQQQDSVRQPSAAALERLNVLKAKYPDPKSAIMPALYIAQEELGHITEGAIQWIAAQLNLSPVHVMEVATFYTMYYKKPVGTYHVQVCRTLSCAIRGAKKLTEHMHQKFGVLPNVPTPDGMFSYEDVECLGSCGTAPMCEINDTYFENLSVEKLDEILTKIAREKPDLRLSAINDTLGNGLAGYAKSQILPE